MKVRIGEKRIEATLKFQLGVWVIQVGGYLLTSLAARKGGVRCEPASSSERAALVAAGFDVMPHIVAQLGAPAHRSRVNAPGPEWRHPDSVELALLEAC
jgi:hypothetical protein